MRIREVFLKALKVYTAYILYVYMCILYIQLEVSFSKSQGALHELDTHLLVSDRLTGKSSTYPYTIFIEHLY